MDRIYLFCKTKNLTNSKKSVYTKKSTSKKRSKVYRQKNIFRLGLTKLSFNHAQKYRAN